MTELKHITIGVLALQGAFVEHIRHLANAIKNGQYEEYHFSFPQVKTPEELATCDALIIPGGESTAMSLIAERTGMLSPLMDFINLEKPVWGTCAGLIFLAKQCVNGKEGQHFLGGMDIEVTRNAFGRQMDSFIADLDFSDFIDGVNMFPTTFIRAPVVSKLLDPPGAIHKRDTEASIIYSKNTYCNPHKVQVLKLLEDRNGFIVAVRQGNKLGTSFHPELSADSRFHKWFVDEFVLGKSY
ncbi:hypothetical protein BABINDRAFT_161538 [Babjeviella inositovora NRRL Y-12698]|uniref:glutaminase n=1 Tax=Babjeviella inositovora NRRL Y-12698 TaxID=984486 RepID=A0A1E3QQC8_9ASCO|nr:uncharacterized protein BABINDRAFT_161538 [Babjeviella inositovora NRRL Y-12698]ODQ79860.1 hypothetical protein BABINDRAFT_161538 [Babjeviella inositovora NRRL Y-12698]